MKPDDRGDSDAEKGRGDRGPSSFENWLGNMMQWLQPSEHAPDGSELGGREPERPTAARRMTASAGPSAESQGVSRDMARILGSFATGIWRIRRRLEAAVDDDSPRELRLARTNAESAWADMAKYGLEIREHTGDRYVPGLALKVLFQPRPGVTEERIEETIKPSVYFRDVLIQRGEVVVAIPESAEPPESSPEQPEEPDGDAPDDPEETRD